MNCENIPIDANACIVTALRLLQIFLAALFVGKMVRAEFSFTSSMCHEMAISSARRDRRGASARPLPSQSRIGLSIAVDLEWPAPSRFGSRTNKARSNSRQEDRRETCESWLGLIGHDENSFR